MHSRLISVMIPLILVMASTATQRSAQTQITADREQHHAAIQAVLAADSEYGRIRNHAPEQGRLDLAIEAYVAVLDSIDFSACPDNFTQAFTAHRDAWGASIPFFAQFPNLRGEMHELFELIRSYGGESEAALERHEAAIWSTWAAVESAAARYPVQ